MAPERGWPVPALLAAVPPVLVIVLGWPAACGGARVGPAIAGKAPPHDALASGAGPGAPSADDAGFHATVLPVLEARCRPCHFEGGVMHARLPFDRPETIRALGEALFTRIKDDSARTTIRAFLARPASPAPAPPAR